MRLGADPDDLERLASTHETCAAHLARLRTTLRSYDRAGWSGPAAKRWWAHLDDALVPSLVAAGNASSGSARRLRAHAREQRRASLPAPEDRTVRIDHRGDGRWVGRTGSVQADVVVVVVPGMGTDVDDVPRLRDDARRLWEVVVSHATSPTLLGDGATERIAVVSWLGYDPPDHLLAGVDRRPAATGAQQLVHDVADLRAAGASRVVVVGHSYGGLVAVDAAAKGMRADAVVMLGSPGTGPGRDALEPGTELWVAAARHDPVSLLARLGAVHGPDPAPAASRLPTSLAGHNAYLRDPVLLNALASQVVLGERL